MAKRHGSSGSSHSKGRFPPQRGCRQNIPAGPTAAGGKSRYASRGSASRGPAQHLPSAPPAQDTHPVPGSGAALRPLPLGTPLSAHPRVTEPRIKQHSYCKNELQQKLLHLSRRKGYIPLLFWYQMAQGLFFNKCCLLYLLTQSPLSYKPNLFP